MEFDRPVDGELGATSGEVEDEDKSPVAALEDTVSRMQRDLEEFSEDAEGIKARAPGATGGTYNDKGTLV